MSHGNSLAPFIINTQRGVYLKAKNQKKKNINGRDNVDYIRFPLEALNARKWHPLVERSKCQIHCKMISQLLCHAKTLRATTSMVKTATG